MQSPPPAISPSPRTRWAAPTCFGVGYAANTAMLWIATRFRFLGYLLVWFAAIYFFLAVPRARRASIHFLDLIRQHQNKKRRNLLLRHWQTYRHMVTFGILLVDRALMLARPSHGFHVDAQGLPNLSHAAALADKNSTGIIMLTAHYGMAEIAAPYFSILGINRRVNIVMFQDPRDGTENFHMRHRRMLKDINVISTTNPLDAGIKIIAALKKGDVVAMRADRTLAGKTVEVTLLGQRILLPAGPFLAAALSESPVVYVYTCRTSYRHYRCTVSEVHRYNETAPPQSAETRDQKISRAAQEFATHLEATLLEKPYQWSNFFDLWNTQSAATVSAKSTTLGAPA